MYPAEGLSKMTLIIMLLCLYFGVDLLKKAAHNLKIAKGFKKDNLATTTGNLTYKKSYQNQLIGTGPITKHYEKQWTQYQYTYHINGKSYNIFGGTPFDPKRITQNVEITYQKSALKYAIIPEIHEPEYENNGDKQLIGGIILTVFAILVSAFVLYDLLWK